MQDPNLVDRLLAEMTDRLKDHKIKDVECIKLLICKSSPFVWGMQKSLKFFLNKNAKKVTENAKGEGGDKPEPSQVPKEETEWNKSEPIQRMYLFLPTVKDVVNYGDKCDDRYPSCFY